MKSPNFYGLLFYAAVVFDFISCGGANTENTTDSSKSAGTDTTAKTTESTTAPTNTIITSSENMMVVTLKVANFSKWLITYEAYDSARVANGLHKYVIGRGLMDSNMVLVAMKADDIAKAKAFGKSPGLKMAMQKGGVMGAPSQSYLISTWQDTAIIDTRLRSRTMFVVKDWSVWMKNFEEGKQERMDNGILDRVVGHDADDDKKVSLVTAVTDTAKAFAYYKSDALKKRREAGGVIGEPVRFLFNIVKRY